MCSETANYSYLNMPTEINDNLIFYIQQINSNVANIEYIKNVFHNLNIGNVKYVHFINHKNMIDKIAFVYMQRWYHTVVVENLQDKIMNDKQEARIIYDDPNFWILKPIQNLSNDNFIEYFGTHNQLLNNYAEKINYLSNQNLEITNQLNEIKYFIGLSSFNNTSNTFINNSCCGAVTSAWNPNGETSNLYL